MSDCVFIVEDSLTVRMDLREALEHAGFDCVDCASLAAARAALTERRPDVVLLDLLLPDGEGLAWLAELRAAPGGADCVVLMLSNVSEAGDRLRGLGHGADDYVGKPYDRHYVVDRARELLRQRRGAVATEPNRLLLIDDSETFRQVLREALESAGYRVSLAASGEQGLRSAAAERPAAVIVDRQLPGMDGAEVIRQLRMDPALRHLPCVLLTASEDADAELQALEAGADAFVRKQEDVELMLARLAAVLRSAAASAPAQSASLLDPKRILAVDDSPTFLAELASMLRDEGYDVLAARSGEQALEMLAAQGVDCVLMDLKMPGMGGQAACRFIKEDPALRDIPLILLTAVQDRSAMLAGLEAGADDFVAKSGEFELLKARVRAQLRRKQFEDEARRSRAEQHHNELEAAAARAARALADSRAELLAALEQKNATLEQMNAELVRASQAKTNFLSTMSHELRTPLNAIIGFSAILRDGMAGDLSERQQDFAGHIHEAGQHLLSLVNDILDLAKIEAGKVDLELAPLELDALLNDTLVVVRERARDQGISLRVQGIGAGRQLRADARRLRQILYNLLSNAVKFTPRGGEIVLQASLVGRLEASQGWPGFPAGRRMPLPNNGFQRFVQISVTDTGAGMTAQALEQLFKPFSQIKGERSAELEGTGLGLATAARLAELHGGCMAVSSAPGSGTCLSFWLPWREPETAEPPPRPEPADTAAAPLPPPAAKAAPTLPAAASTAAAPGNTRPRALVVEDNEHAALLMQAQLEAAGFEVHLAASAEAALDGAGVGLGRPDLITLDVRLPGIDGWELLSRFKALPGWAHIPVVVVSVDGGHEVGLSLGAAAVLQKPIDRQELNQELELLGFKPTPAREFLVLVINDEPVELEQIGGYLSRPGFSVLRAYGGTEGIELARRYRPDLIVLDLLMSGVGGIEVVEALRQDAKTASIPVIVMAARDFSEQDRERLASHVQSALNRRDGASNRFLGEVRRAFARSSWGELE
ncbi:response regulator [Roseateles sp. DAIF2]|uniref:response regulator n=1 Tax=Roseateles sp. DAIF2 TaxID=2714952 RepID=UPI0018A2F50F|nr:response regulator [Roseateles sp. DAIF2]QPF75486.1 response regulator [Roseateles sp. DAIF2]